MAWSSSTTKIIGDSPKAMLPICPAREYRRSRELVPEIMYKSELNDIPELGQQVVGNRRPSARLRRLIGCWSQAEPGTYRPARRRPKRSVIARTAGQSAGTVVLF